MRRILCITGLLFFAVLIGDTAGRLQRLYKEGILFEQYNSQRKADITLFAVSVCGLIALGYIEFIRPRRRVERPGFASMAKAQEPAGMTGSASTNIYSAPKAIDEWQERQSSPGMPKLRNRQKWEITGLWMGVLRVCCGVLPVVYLYIFLDYIFIWLPTGAGTLTLSILFPILMLGAVLTSVGILRKKKWGMKFGYAMAVFHLLIFPIGTAAGFVMLIGLVGAASEFDTPTRKRRTHKTKSNKPQSAVL